MTHLGAQRDRGGRCVIIVDGRKNEIRIMREKDEREKEELDLNLLL